jgi:phosphatidate cytidylyltransferase
VLKQRVITGAVLVLLVMISILLLPNIVFAFIAAAVVLGIGGWEWAKLAGLNDVIQQILFIVSLLLFALAIYLSLYAFWQTLVIVGLVVWVAILYLLMTYHQDSLLYQNTKWLLPSMAFPVLLTAWASILILQVHNADMLLYLILLIAVADSSAYFMGKRFGKNKLAPQLSPGKTLEGMLGAIIGASIWSLFAAIYFDLGQLNWPFFMLLSIVTAILSIGGDLFESLLKREACQKDSGTILPGHGGILDRIDSLLAAAPFFTMGIVLGGIRELSSVTY